jgi:outer membrane protein OmpA-like peptidoglycan-associated protein
MKNFVTLGFAAFAIAGLAGNAAADGPKNLGAQPSRDQLIEMLLPHGGAAGPNERGLRVRAANPADSAPAGSDASADSAAPAVALDVKFALNSATLTAAAKDTLRRLGAAIKSEQLANFRFRVEGHTDASGRPDHNLVLSQRRAEAVRDYLVQDLGVAPARLDVVGRGQQDPLDAANPLSGVNRRVQVVNLGQ